MRYIRQQIFAEIGKKGQQKIRKSAVAVVGLGAIGSASAELLARAGIGKLILIDRDVVELTNLQRQSLFDENDIGKPKSFSCKEHLKKINSETKIDFYIDDLNFENIDKIFSVTCERVSSLAFDKKKFDLILDCTDNLETRFLINDYSIKNGVPFIYASAVGSKGYVFDVVPNKTACLRCFLNEAKSLDTCETAGVLNTITHLISSVQVTEALKIILNKNYEKDMLYFNIWRNELPKIRVSKNKDCICCAKNNFEYLDGKKFSPSVKICGANMYQIRGKFFDTKNFANLKNKLRKIGKTLDFEYCISFDGKITIFKDGRALIKARDEKEAKSLYSKFVGN